MCNLYSMTRSRDEIRRLFRIDRDDTANQPPLPAIFPDQPAPVIRTARDGTRVMQTMRWGFPPPPNLGTRPVTNIRNTASPYWRGWLKPEFRCLVPATSFCEYTDSQPKVPHWFALGPDRPAFAFAGLWRPWTGKRKGEEGEHLLFAFLTTDANEVVRPVHAKAMPVVLSAEEGEAWLTADIPAALALQRKLAPERLVVIATGERQDPPAAAAPAQGAPGLGALGL
ncbi:MAG TPA: SOS response-associated peptidase [Acetobacteraceae bacterium]|nr:SOS response-associated peptidase [Acetobacteraceae bacterium]